MMKHKQEAFYPEGLKGQARAWYLSQVNNLLWEGYTKTQAEILAHMLYHQTTGYRYFMPAVTFKIEGGLSS